MHVHMHACAKVVAVTISAAEQPQDSTSTRSISAHFPRTSGPRTPRHFSQCRSGWSSYRISSATPTHSGKCCHSCLHRSYTIASGSSRTCIVTTHSLFHVCGRCLGKQQGRHGLRSFGNMCTVARCTIQRLASPQQVHPQAALALVLDKVATSAAAINKLATSAAAINKLATSAAAVNKLATSAAAINKVATVRYRCPTTHHAVTRDPLLEE